jgi:hypothetical protein
VEERGRRLPVLGERTQLPGEKPLCSIACPCAIAGCCPVFPVNMPELMDKKSFPSVVVLWHSVCILARQKMIYRDHTCNALMEFGEIHGMLF